MLNHHQAEESVSSDTPATRQPEDLSLALIKATRQLYDGDRRFHVRSEIRGCRMQVRSYHGSHGVWHQAEPEDFSRGGTLLLTPHRYKKGDLLWMMIKPDRATTHLDAFMVGGEVRHSTQVGEQYRIGIQFRVDLIQDMRRVHAQNALARLEKFLQVLNVADRAEITVE